MCVLLLDLPVFKRALPGGLLPLPGRSIPVPGGMPVRIPLPGLIFFVLLVLRRCWILTVFYTKN